jgi:hypothetical protein
VNYLEAWAHLTSRMGDMLPEQDEEAVATITEALYRLRFLESFVRPGLAPK